MVAFEVSRWLGLRNYHPPSYYLLCSGLALGASLVFGLAARLFGRTAGLTREHALALWAAGTAALVLGPLAGLAVGAAALLSLGLDIGPQRPGPLLLGAAVGAGTGVALLRAEAFAAHVPFFSEALALPFVAFALVFLLLYGVPRVLVPFHGPLRSTAWSAIPILVAAWFALEPWTQRASGGHRRPPARFAESRPLTEAQAQQPNVVVLVLDTLRADRMSVYGYERETTPELARHLDERENAVAFSAAYSNGTWTVPSHASLFTGLMPNQHGAHFALDGSLRVGFGLHEGTPRLAATLQENGYATMGVYANHWLRVMDGVSDGFDIFFQGIHFEPLPLLGEALRRTLVPGVHVEVTKGSAPRADMVNRSLLDLATNWSQGVEHPLYLFANYGDTHGPYVPPAPFRGTFHPRRLREVGEHLSIHMPEDDRERLSARYDEELLYLDHQLGQLLDGFDDLGLLDETWVFITSDHGEAFAEHGITEHGTTVYDEVVRVPLLVFPPEGVALGEVGAPVSLVDVSATVAALVGSDLPGSPGRDLRSLDPERAAAGVEFYGDAAKAAIHGEVAALPQRSIRVGTWKLTERGTGDAAEVELYDLATDPGETTDVSADNVDLSAELRARLTPFGEPARSRAPIDPDQQRRLEQMGYVGGDGGAAGDESPGSGPGNGSSP